jgi:hypothetical protein
VQVASIKARVESAAWYQRLKLLCDEVLSNFAFNFNLRRYIEEGQEPAGAHDHGEDVQVETG